MELTKNQHILNWINEQVALTKPDQVIWIDGSEAQLEGLREEACATGEITKLNQEKLPGWRQRFVLLRFSHPVPFHQYSFSVPQYFRDWQYPEPFFRSAGTDRSNRCRSYRSVSFPQVRMQHGC